MKMLQTRENVPVVIFRPAIITGSYREPAPGWIDSPVATAGLTMIGGMGLVSHLRTDNFKVVADLVPVDYVVNAMMVAAYEQANKNELIVMNYGSSHKKPMLWFEYYDSAVKYFKQYPMNNTIFAPSINFEKYKTVLDIKVLFQKEIPAYVLYYYSRALGDTKTEAMANRLMDANRQIKNLRNLFEFFF